MKTKILFLIFISAVVISCTNKKASNKLVSSPSKFQLVDKSKSSKKQDIFSKDSFKTSRVNYFIEQLDNTKGLSNSSVNTIFQDSQNLLWVGTWDGLNRYDGNNFKIFRPELNKENSLSNQVILKIDEDDTGLIWVLTMSGITSYHKQTNSFQRYYFSNKNKFTLSENEFNMAIDNSKKVFCAVKDWGIGYFDDDQFRKIGVRNLPIDAVKKMLFSPSGKLLMLFENNELFSLEVKTKKAGRKYISKVEMIAKNIRAFETLPEGKICLVSIKGDVVLHTLLNKKKQKLNRNNVQNIIGNTSKGLVLSSKKGYFMVNNSGIIRDQSLLEHINNRSITTLIQGTENVIWTGTDGDGLLKIYPHKKPFNLVTTKQIPELEGGIVRAFTEADGKSFFIGTKGKGLFQFPSKFYINPNKKLKYRNFNESNSSINNSVFALYKGQEELIFIGTDGEGISIFDLRKSKIINWHEILGYELCEYFKSTYAIYQDDYGFIWLGTNGYGLIRFKIGRIGEKLKVSHFKIYRAGNEEDKALSSNIIFSIIPKNKNELWIGTRLGGLNQFNKNSELFKVFKNDKNKPQSLSSNDILSLYVDTNERLWIGTSFGLNLLENINNNNFAFRSFTVKEGLPNNTIHGVVSDKKGNLWVSTNFGLSNFIVKENKFINFTKQEGLQNNEYADGAYYQDSSSGYIFMGGIKGFNYFLPSKIEQSTLIPDILIDKISGQNQVEPYYQSLVVSPDSNIPPSIVLDYNQNFFDIELSALTYINSEKCQYAYYLSNFDQDWNEIKNRRTISFTNVPQGNYSLWIKWSNSDGIWSDPVKAIDVRIKPVFWQSNLAITIYLVLFILFILFVISYYQKRQSLRQTILFRKRDEEIHQNRLTFFTNIAHELQTPLTLIVAPAQKLSESINISEKNHRFIKMVQQNSSRLLFLTQQLLEFRKAEYDYLEVIVKQFDLVNLVEQIAELFDEWALEKNINYTLEIPSELQGWFDKDKIEKIIFNLLSNAFKYTPENGKIKLQLLIQDNEIRTLKIRVSNTGKGIPKEKLDAVFDRFFLSDIGKNSDTNMFRTGIGLAYIKRLVTVLRGEISVSSKANKKTTFTIVLPCSKKSFNENEFDEVRSQILISHHLKNILEDTSFNSELAPNKISSLESVIDTRKIILIVEDEKEIHVLLNELLQNKYKILTAYNGIEALKIIEKVMPDIIISDVMMPEMDGIELCSKIKGDDKTCHIPFIMLTAKNSVIHRIEGLESGANSYIPKPFYPNHLLIRVQKLLEENELILSHLAKDTFFEEIANLPVKNEEKEFVRSLISLIYANIENENLQNQFIEKNLGISSSQLYRKIKQIFGFSLSDLVRTIRLKHAAKLLRKSSLTVSEVCYQSGFNNRSYFYREFKKMYKSTPKNYQLKNKSVGKIN